MYRKLVYAALCLTLILVVVGAYVRLQDAGLGCPDWPGCYGHLVGIPDEAHEIERATQAFPERPVEAHKAWKEMFHRYIAGTLGILLFAIAITAWWRRDVLRQSPLLPTAIVLLAALQAALGMWTVTLQLMPVIVTLHLLGGMTTLALMTWLALRQHPRDATGTHSRNVGRWAVLGLVILVCQIALGGWVSANYAALVCPDFPACRGAWLPDMDFARGFELVRDLARTSGGDPLGIEAMTAIHWAHRLGALITFGYLLAFAIVLIRTSMLRWYGLALALLITTQVGLGIANVLLRLPLVIAAGHNAVAAILLMLMVVINFALARSSDRTLARVSASTAPPVQI